MAINPINNKEATASIRQKLNAMIAAINAGIGGGGGIPGPPGPPGQPGPPGTTNYYDLANRPDITGIIYASRAVAVASNVDPAVRTLTVIVDGRVLTYARDPSGTALVTADGAKWSPADMFISPKHFGAKGDGVTDDSASITAADAYAAANVRTLYFEKGSYAASGLIATVGWDMADDAKLLYNGATEGECLRLSVNGKQFGRVHMDLNGLEPRTGFYIDGSNNSFSRLRVFNCISSNRPWVVRSIYVVGDRNTVDNVDMKDLINTGNANDSSPQGFVLSGTADGNVVRSNVSFNVRTGVVDNSSGRNSFGEIIARDCKDNAFYGVGLGSKAAIGTIIYEGDNSAAGFRHGANAEIGTINVLRSNAVAVFFGDCADITIGAINVHNHPEAILHLNLANTGKIKIGSIKGTVLNSGVIAMPYDSGSVDFLSIDEMDVQVTLDATFTGSTRSMVRLDAAKGLNLGRIKVDVIRNGYAVTDPMYAQINGALTYPSFIDSLRFAVFGSDRVTPDPLGAACFVIAHVAGVTAPIPQANLILKEGALNASGALRPYTWGGFFPGRLTSPTIPAAGSGTWKRGEVVWSQTPSASLRGWTCNTAGTPGTWTAF